MTCITTVCFAAPAKTLPFTAEEDADGSRMVWFLLNVSGLKSTKHAHISARDIPKSNRWLKLEPSKPLQEIDMAWWPNGVAILSNKKTETFNFKGNLVQLSELERRFGKPEYRRFNTADKPIALVIFNDKQKEPSKIPAILPETDLYAAIFDLAINTTGPRCTHNPNDVWISIADTDEKRVYEIDHAGCITGAERKVDKDFLTLIGEMQKKGRLSN